MRYIEKLFSTSPPLSKREVQRRRTVNQNLLDYYTNKIKFLSKKKHHTHLLKLSCRDTPFVLKSSMTEYDKRVFIKACLKFYKNKLKVAQKKLKKLNRIYLD